MSQICCRCAREALVHAAAARERVEQFLFDLAGRPVAMARYRS